jgi:hypothetical protein
MCRELNSKVEPAEIGAVRGTQETDTECKQCKNPDTFRLNINPSHAEIVSALITLRIRAEAHLRAPTPMVSPVLLPTPGCAPSTSRFFPAIAKS